MKKLKLNCEGKTEEDLVLAMEEATRLVRQGFGSGFDRNEDGNFHFEVKEAA